MRPLSEQNLKKVYRELDEVGVAISVVGTRRPKLMALARMTVPIGDALVGTRPEVRRVRDDLVRLSHNVRRARTRARPASQAVRALADQVKVVEALLKKGLGEVPEGFSVGKLELRNTWGYTKKEVTPFLDALREATDTLEKIGLTKSVGTGDVTLDPSASPRAAMTYDLFADTFAADPMRERERERDITRALGERLWWKHFEGRDAETWGGGADALSAFFGAFHRLLFGRKLRGDALAKMSVSLGRVIGPERWRKVA